MLYSDILSFIIESSEDLNSQLASVIKSESALKVSNESANYYALANEAFTDNAKKYALAAWNFIKELVKKIKNFIVTAYNKIKEFISKRINAIKAKLSKKKDGNNTKSKEDKTEPAHEAADQNEYYEGIHDIRYYADGAEVAFGDVKSMTEELNELIKDIEKVGSFQPEEISSMHKEIIRHYDAFNNNLKSSIISRANKVHVNRVPAAKYPEFLDKYLDKYKDISDTSFKILTLSVKRLDATINSLSNNKEYTSDQVSLLKEIVQKISLMCTKTLSIMNRITVLNFSLVPFLGFNSEDAAKSALEEYKSKISSIFDE